MSATVLLELTADSGATADRLVQLSAEQRLDSAETEYIVAAGLAALQKVPKLWPIIRAKIGGGTPASAAHEVLTRLREVTQKNLLLAGKLRESVRELSNESLQRDAVAELGAAEKKLLDIGAQTVRLLKIIGAPARWPSEEELSEARERMRIGDRLASDQFRQALLDE